ncbi:MAG TPA: hypothetical protein PK156_09030, partial [Polyangium sp.]|nr:hypothetical protein [Polyangium sp.]
GALQDIGHLPAFKIKALAIGLFIGIVTTALRKILHANPRYRDYVKGSRKGFVVGFCVDAFLLPSPYASSFGGFVELMVTFWFGLGGVMSSAFNTWQERKSNEIKEQKKGYLPEDMSTTSLVGGGLIAGEALFALCVGVIGLVQNVLLKPAAPPPPPPPAP